MALLDVLQKLFTQSTASAMPSGGVQGGKGILAFGKGEGAAPASDPVMSFLQNSGLLPQVDKKQEMRMAIARGLADFGKNIGSSTQDFLPALGAALPAGASSFVDAREETGKKVDTRNKDVLDKMLGIAKTDEANNLKAQKAADTAEYNDRRLTLQGERIDLMEKLGLGRLFETGRHNKATEGQGEKRIDLQVKRLEAAGKKAERDAEKFATELAGAELDAQGKQATIESRIQSAKTAKAKELGLDDPSFATLDPEGHADAQEEFETYSNELDKRVRTTIKTTGPKSQGGSPATPGAAKPQVSYTKEKPATIDSNEAFEALPIGSWFINPSDGRLMRKSK